MKVPLLDLKAQHDPIRKEILAAIEGVFENNSFILGEEVSNLEQRIAAYCQTQHAIGVSSGTDALLVSLMALGVGPRHGGVQSINPRKASKSTEWSRSHSKLPSFFPNERVN